MKLSKEKPKQEKGTRNYAVIFCPKMLDSMETETKFVVYIENNNYPLLEFGKINCKI